MIPLTVRLATAVDVVPLFAIYNHYIATSFATFDEQVKGAAEQNAWFQRYQDNGRYRLFVAERGDKVIGCAYSSPYRPHAAFSETVEVSAYLAPDARGAGVGTALYSELFRRLAHERLHRAVCAIALPNKPSIALHRRFGFRDVGVFNEYALKNGIRASSLWMEKAMDGAW